MSPWWGDGVVSIQNVRGAQLRPGNKVPTF